MLKKVLLGVLLVVLIVVGILWGKPIYTRVSRLVIPEPKLVTGVAKEFTVNLVDPGMRRYLRVKMTFEYLETKALLKELDSREPEVRDAVIGVLRTKTVPELSSGEAMQQLRKELIASINSVLSSGEITDVFFTEFVIQ